MPPPAPSSGDQRGPTGPDDETRPVPVDPVAPPIAPEPRRTRKIDRWTAPPPDARPYRSSFVGMAGMAMMLFIVLASGAVLPWWAIAALTVVWAAALLKGIRWFVRHPGRVLLLPLLMLVLWLGTLMGGVALFGWGT
jgi:hypothetical protein